MIKYIHVDNIKTQQPNGFGILISICFRFSDNLLLNFMLIIFTFLFILLHSSFTYTHIHTHTHRTASQQVCACVDWLRMGVCLHWSGIRDCKHIYCISIFLNSTFLSFNLVVCMDVFYFYFLLIFYFFALSSFLWKQFPLCD